MQPFLKFIMNVIEYYCKPNEHMSEITVVLDLNKVDKNLNIDFLCLLKFQKEYEEKIMFRKFYIINCPSVLKKYICCRPFLHPEPKKVCVIKEEKSLPREHYFTL